MRAPRANSAQRAVADARDTRCYVFMRIKFHIHAGSTYSARRVWFGVAIAKTVWRICFGFNKIKDSTVRKLRTLGDGWSRSNGYAYFRSGFAKWMVRQKSYLPFVRARQDATVGKTMKWRAEQQKKKNAKITLNHSSIHFCTIRRFTCSLCWSAKESQRGLEIGSELQLETITLSRARHVLL